MKPTLLIVDDDDEIRTQMKWALAAEYQIVMAEDRASGLEALRMTKLKASPPISQTQQRHV